MLDLGDRRASTTVRFMWPTNAIAGESITRATNGSLRIYKGSSTTERTSSNGITDTEDYDTLTGIHHCAIDLSDNTDSGFYAAANDYFVVLQGAVIDGKTINHPLAMFSIENRNPQVDVTKFGGTSGAFASGRPEVNATHISGDGPAADALETMLDGTGGNTLKLGKLHIVATAQTGGAIEITNTDGPGISSIAGGSSKAGMYLAGAPAGGLSAGLFLQGRGTSPGLDVESEASDAIAAFAQGTGKAGFLCVGSTDGPSIYLIGQGTGNAIDLETANGHGINFDVAGSGKVPINIAAVIKLLAMMAAAPTITVDDTTFTPTTTAFETDQTADVDKEYTNQVLFGLTGANAGCALRITAYAFTNSKVKLTVSEMETAPADGDTFMKMGRQGG